MNKNSHNEVEQRKKGITPNNESIIKNGLDHNELDKISPMDIHFLHLHP